MKSEHVVDGVKCGEHLGAFTRRNYRPSRTFQRTRRTVRIHANNEDVAERLSALKVTDMAYVEEVKAAVRGDHGTSLTPRARGDRDNFLERFDLVASPFHTVSFYSTVYTAMGATIRKILANAFTRHQEVVRESESSIMAEVVRGAALLFRVARAGKRVFSCGNGGSAADSQHFAAEWVCRYARVRRPLPAIALTTDTSVLTAVGNDCAYKDVFVRQLAALGRRGDVLLAFTTSGKSENVIAAVRYAKRHGMRVVLLTGAGGRRLGRMADVAVIVPSRETARIQEVHELVYHGWCEYVDMQLASMR